MISPVCSGFRRTRPTICGPDTSRCALGANDKG
jgi:hypothetical protein